MKCGNNIPPEEGKDVECNVCDVPTILIFVTEKNKNILPWPSDPIGLNDIDLNNPGNNCQCAPGMCPCGKFVAHLASEAWDPDNPHIFGAEWDAWNENKQGKGQ